MDLPVHQLDLRGVMPTRNGTAIFFANKPVNAAPTKTFVIHTAPDVGRLLAFIIEGKTAPRPLTHDLIKNIFTGFDISVVHVLFTKVEKGVFFANLCLSMQNELGTKIVSIDARPSDAVILALQAKCPILASQSVIENAEDESAFFEKVVRSAQAIAMQTKNKD
jgi:bifunctional DNase/RNase